MAGAESPKQSSELAPGSVLNGRYVLMIPLGEGGMSKVFSAHDRWLDRSVAIKVMHNDQDSQALVRLTREAHALAKLNHPNVVQVHEIAQDQGTGRLFIAMEFVEGKDLASYLNSGRRLSIEGCLEMFLEVGRGLAAIHEVGLVHRDVKPGNIMLGDGRGKIADLGLVCRPGKEDSESHSKSTGTADVFDKITSTRQAMGTVNYMAPEQLSDGEIGPQSDQFSFCISLYEGLCGRLPYDEKTEQGLINAILLGKIKPFPPKIRISKRLKKAILRGLSINPKDRWPSMEALLNEIKIILAPNWRRRLVATFALGASLGFAYNCSGDDKVSCAGQAMDEMGQVWNDGHREQVRAILEDAGSDDSEATQLVLDRFDAFAQRWIEARRQVYEYIEDNPEEEGISFCLDIQRLAFESKVQGILTADQKDLSIDKLNVALPDLNHCHSPQ